LYRALEKQTAEEKPNLYFLRFDAKYLADIFAEHEVDRIYLNFSDPWPKDRHSKRRLTSEGFLNLYHTKNVQNHNATGCSVPLTRRRQTR